jgi:hypothetical protein
MRRCLFIGLLSLLAPPSASSSHAQTVGLPSGTELVSRHVAAIGGAAAFKSVKSIREKGKLEIAAQGLSGDFEVLMARPARMFQRLTLPGMGEFQEGYDGKVGWSIDPQSGPSLYADRLLTEMAEDAWFDGPLHTPSRFREFTTVERTEFDKRPAYKVRAVFVTGLEQFEYFDAETSLQIGWEASRATPNGILPTVTRFREYKRFGALMRPTVVVTRQLGADFTMRLLSCDYNVVPSSAFDLPKAIKALIIK